MGAMIITDYGNVSTRRTAARKDDTDFILGLKIIARMGSMIMVGIFHGDMAIRPETQYISGSVSVPESEMAKDREYQYKGKPSFGTP
jgi:hypothetical protein